MQCRTAAVTPPFCGACSPVCSGSGPGTQTRESRKPVSSWETPCPSPVRTDSSPNLLAWRDTGFLLHFSVGLPPAPWAGRGPQVGACTRHVGRGGGTGPGVTLTRRRDRQPLPPALGTGRSRVWVTGCFPDLGLNVYDCYSLSKGLSLTEVVFFSTVTTSLALPF